MSSSDRNLNRSWRDTTNLDELKCHCGNEITDVHGAAIYLKVSTSTVYAMVSEGRLKKSVSRQRGALRFHKPTLVREFFGRR